VLLLFCLIINTLISAEKLEIIFQQQFDHQPPHQQINNLSLIEEQSLCSSGPIDQKGAFIYLIQS